MKRVFGAKKNTEPPPTIQDATDRVFTFSIFSFISSGLKVVLFVGSVRVFSNFDEKLGFFFFNFLGESNVCGHSGISVFVI